MLKLFSSGIAKIPHLEAFLEEEFARFGDPARVEAVAGWGHKDTADKARAYAKAQGVPYLALEDGFIRSLDLGVNGAAPLSLSVDPLGCYYDAADPSLIESLLSSADEWFDESLKKRSRVLIDRIMSANLSKYNCAPDLTAESLPSGFEKESKLLILDQCQGDASLSLGRASSEVGAQMIARAHELFPEHVIYVKSHPDVLSGKRQGLFDLKSLTSDPKVRAWRSEVSAPSLLKHFKVVFTATSQAGFEALMAGAQVHVFGLPFYAGYGLTFDEKTEKRRQGIHGVTLEMLFAAAYLKTARYVNPISGRRCELEEIIELLALQKEINDENRHHSVVYGVKRWKRPILRAYLGCVGAVSSGQCGVGAGLSAKAGTADAAAGADVKLRGSSGTAGCVVSFTKSRARGISRSLQQKAVLTQWASKEDFGLTLLARARGVRTLAVEDGFLRSQGLGCNHARPFSLVFDDEGIYYDPSCPSRLERILNTVASLPEHERLVERAQALRKAILRGRLTKYNVGLKEEDKLRAFKEMLPKDKKIILVPGQVEDDASVRTAGGGITSNGELLKAVRSMEPDAFIVYKPHPDVLALNRKGGLKEPWQENALFDLEVRELSIASLYELVDEVHVLTSQSGFEAMLRELPVTVHGLPFYAGWGLTRDVMHCPRRKARLTLDELAAGVLILYPRYFDWCTLQFMRPEYTVYRLQHMGDLPKDSIYVTAARLVYDLRRAAFRFFAGDK